MAGLELGLSAERVVVVVVVFIVGEPQFFPRWPLKTLSACGLETLLDPSQPRRNNSPLRPTLLVVPFYQRCGLFNPPISLSPWPTPIRRCWTCMVWTRSRTSSSYRSAGTAWRRRRPRRRRPRRAQQTSWAPARSCRPRWRRRCGGCRSRWRTTAPPPCRCSARCAGWRLGGGDVKELMECEA